MDLREYVKYYRTHGYTDEQLEEHLVQQGYKEEEVKAALNAGHVPWLLISLIAIVTIVFALGVYLFMNTVDVTEVEVPQEVLEANQVVEQPEETGPPEITEDFCEGRACAEEALAECKPTKGSYSMFLIAEVEYEVLGPKEGYCEVYAKLIKAPKDELEGKDMTCLVDGTLPIKDALADLSRCQGPLVDAYSQIE